MFDLGLTEMDVPGEELVSTPYELAFDWIGHFNPSFRQGIAIREHPLQRATGRGRDQAVGGQRGRQLDNALAETIKGLYKAEVIHRRSWCNREQVERATLDWVHWYNHKGLLGPIGHVPPAEAEAAYYRQQASQAKAA